VKKTLIPPDPRIERARYGLILDAPFFGSLMVRLPIIRDDSRRTFCTDGTVIRYNQPYADRLDMEEIRYVLCHEIMHCAMGHLWRLCGRELETWNRACDYTINQMLDDYAQTASPVPWRRPKGLLDIAGEPRFRGLSAEEIYGLMMQDKQQQQPPPGNAASQPDPNSPPQSGQGTADPDVPSKPGQGAPDSNGQRAAGEPGIGDFESAPADPAPSGEAGADAGLKQDWQIATAQAERIALMKGNCPGAASRLVEEMKAPKVSWREVLREFIRKTARADYSFSRPNRRHLARGFILPGLHSERMGRLVAGFDSSDSTIGYLADFQAEVQAALDECLPERLDVIVCDAKVQHIQKFEPGDKVMIDAKGGGGTDFRPVFEHIDIDGDKDEDEPPICVVYLTDLDGTFPIVEPGYPVLWCVPPGVRSRCQPPFGEIVAVK
jgi:predicted metal-dependent peptidase